MYNLVNSCYCDIKIDNNRLEPGKVQLVSIIVRSHIQYSVPVLELKLIDTSNFFADKSIVDSSTIEVMLSNRAEDNSNWAKFKVFKVTPSPSMNNGGKNYSISAYFGVTSDYLFEKTNEVFNGTSTAIMSKIAEKFSLTLEADIATDKDSWRCSNKTLAEFVKQSVLPAGNVSNSSGMVAGINPWNSKLYYKDIANLITKKPKYKLTNIPSEGYDFVFVEYKYSSSSGLLNKQAGGYGLETKFFDIESGVHTTFSGVDVKKVSKNININKDMIGTLTNKVLPSLDIGNVSAKFQKSLGQNKRILGTFSVSLDILLRNFTDIGLFDILSIDIADTQGTKSIEPTMSGSYIVIGKASVVVNGEYAEKICMTRNTSNYSSSQLV
jgi:hypothetical protein